MKPEPKPESKSGAQPYSLERLLSHQTTLKSRQKVPKQTGTIKGCTKQHDLGSEPDQKQCNNCQKHVPIARPATTSGNKNGEICTPRVASNCSGIGYGHHQPRAQ